MSINPPFSAKMDTDQFMLMAQSFREKGQPLVECYANAETVHEAFFNQTRFKSFESFRTEYYRKHPTKRE